MGVLNLSEYYDDESDVRKRMKHLRSLMLIHSYIYYWLDNHIVSDHKWQEWADDLARLQKKHPRMKLDYYDDAFVGWDGSTGCHLPYDDWVQSKSVQLLKYHENLSGTKGISSNVVIEDENVSLNLTTKDPTELHVKKIEYVAQAEYFGSIGTIMKRFNNPNFQIYWDAAGTAHAKAVE